MQTDATSHNIVGPNNVGCCWPTVLRPFAWALMRIEQMIIHSNLSKMKNNTLQTCYKENIDSLGEFSNISYDVFGSESSIILHHILELNICVP